LHAIKHFPGHGNTKIDSHLGLPVLDDDKETLLQTDIFPFTELIKEGVDAVMVGHLAVPALTDGNIESASLSPTIVKGFLRGELGFEGVVVTDAMNMRAISLEYDKPGELELAAFTAGNDVLCYCPNPVAGIQAIFENATEGDIKTAFKRVWALKQKAFQDPKKSPQYLPEAVNLNSCLAKSCITLYCGEPDGIAHFVKQGFGIVECGSGAQADSGVVVDSSSLIVPGESFSDRIREQFEVSEFKTVTQTVDEFVKDLKGRKISY